MKNLISLLVIVMMATPQVVFARNSTLQTSQSFDTTTPTDAASTTTTTVPSGGETIQTLAQQSQDNNNKGQMLAMAAVGVTAVGVMMTCNGSPPNPSCPYWKWGLGASIAAQLYMMLAKKKSDSTAEAVTNNAVNPTTGTTTPTTPVIENPENPNYPEYFSGTAGVAAKKLYNEGYRINATNGTVTTPTGQTIPANVLNSPASMKAAGFSDATIKEFGEAMSQAVAKANSATPKTADTGDLFGDSIGGGGAGGNSGHREATANAGPPSPKLGIDRNPSQVAGMSKLYNGEKIGVAADSAFGMIQRRYDLHEKNGSFLPQK